jgi:hypothetical protein
MLEPKRPEASSVRDAGALQRVARAAATVVDLGVRTYVIGEGLELRLGRCRPASRNLVRLR